VFESEKNFTQLVSKEPNAKETKMSMEKPSSMKLAFQALLNAQCF
jgi:hypothetical protein